MASSISIRSCEVVTRLNDNEGNPIIQIEQIQKVLEEKKNCIRNYAYIIHDKDPFSAEDESKNPAHKAGTPKPAHVHVILVGAKFLSCFEGSLALR